MPKKKLSDFAIQGLTKPGWYADEQLSGFYVRVRDSGRKFFVVSRKIKGEPTAQTVTIGEHMKPFLDSNNETVRDKNGRPELLSYKNARDLAMIALAKLGAGIDVNQQRKAVRERSKEEEEQEKNQCADDMIRSVTLKEVFDCYLNEKTLKDSTKVNYGYVIRSRVGDWLDLPVASITREMIRSRHREITAQGFAPDANNAMRVLRALFTFAADKYETSDGEPLIKTNPVRKLDWNRSKRRQGVIKAYELKQWWSAVNSLPNRVVADYLIILLLSGLRAAECAGLKWSAVDMTEKTFVVEEPKNHQRHTLPMSGYIHKVFLRRLSNRESGSPQSDYVFPGNIDGHTNEDIRYHIEMMVPLADRKPKSQRVLKSDAITDVTFRYFMPHDLRRSFLTVADSLDLSSYAIKRLANHKMTADVTAGYIVSDVERLREPMERITNLILSNAGVQEQDAQVLPMTAVGN